MPTGSVVVVILRRAETVIVSCRAAECALLSITLTVKVLELAAVGVPEMTPVLDAKDSPGGTDPDVTDQLYGAIPPLADSVAE
jgi:hypothetical protein